MPSIDILIPFYNDVAALELSLGSIAAQDFDGDLRTVIYDDGSRPENHAAMLAMLERWDLAFTVIRNPQNRGRPYARNALLDAVTGDYVAWLDAGDEWHPAKLRLQHTALQKHEARSPGTPVWATCKYHMQWPGRPRGKANDQTPQGDAMRTLLAGRHLRAYLWTLLIPASTLKAVGYFDENLPRMQDLDYFIRFLLVGGSFINVSSIGLCTYHKSDEGRDSRQISACAARIFKKYRFLYRSYGRAFTQQILHKNEMVAARFALNNRDPLRAGFYMARAFLRSPRIATKSTIGFVVKRLGPTAKPQQRRSA